MKLKYVLAAGSLISVIVGMAWNAAVERCEAAGATVSLAPPSQSVALNQGQFSVDVVVQGAAGVGAFEFQLRFDPSVITYVGIERGPFMDGAGAQVSCAVYVPPEKNSVQYGCGTLGSVGRPIPGASGSGVLATVRFVPAGPGSTDLVFTRLTLTRPDVCFETCTGNEDDLPVEARDGAVRVYDPAAGEALPPPTPRPDVRRLTPTPIANAVATPSLSLNSGGSRSPSGLDSSEGERGVGSQRGSTPTGGSSSPSGGVGSSLFSSRTSSTDDTFPIAGYGAYHRAPEPRVGWITMAIGIAGLVLTGAASRRRGYRRPSPP